MTPELKFKLFRAKQTNYYYKFIDNFYILCPNVAEFFKNVLTRQKKAHFEKKR